MLIDADKIVVRDRIRKDYGNLEELANDIKENGLINPPVVTPDNILIAGERRYLAMTKVLGWKQIEVRPMTVQDALHQLKLEISENENRKDFSFSEKMDWASKLKEEYRKIAEANSMAGTTGTDVTLVGRVDDRVAEQTGLGSREKLRKGEYIKEHADEEMIRHLDEGQLSINAAYTQLKKRAEEAERKLHDAEAETEKFKVVAVDAVRAAEGAAKASDDSAEYLRIVKEKEEVDEERRKYYEKWKEEKNKDKGLSADEVQKKVDEAVAKTKQDYRKLVDAKEKTIAELQNQEPETVEVEVEVIPEDYKQTKQELAELKEEFERLRKEASRKASHEPQIRVVDRDTSKEELARIYFNDIQNSSGTFLAEMEGLALSKDLCNYLPPKESAALAENFRLIASRAEEMLGYIWKANKEAIA